MRNRNPPRTPSRAAPAKNLRWLSSGLVARFRRIYIVSCAYSPLTTVQHPANQAVKFAVGEGALTFAETPFENGGTEERTHFALKFFFEWRDKLRQAKAQTRDADGLDAFLPGVLIIGGQRVDLFQQHLRGYVPFVGRQFGAAVACQDALA